jgi:hypothetical protein
MPLILITIGIVLIIYNYRSLGKENKMTREDDGLNISFQSILQDNKEELNDYKIEIGLLRRDIAESLTEIQEEIIEIRNELNKLKDGKEVYENKSNLDSEYSKVDEIIEKVDKISFASSNIDDGIISEIDFSESSNSNKTESIRKLLKEGFSEEEICYELSVSKGEVLLVKGLFKK